MLKSNLDRATRRKVGAIVRSYTVGNAGPRFIIGGLCSAISYSRGEITPEQHQDILNAVRHAFSVMGKPDNGFASAYMPTRFEGHSVSAKREEFIRRTWLRRWEEKGEAMNYDDWHALRKERRERHKRNLEIKRGVAAMEPEHG